ncbi:MAG: lipopolysaccharide heptosyltransferase II [Acidobacteria bacterium]|nr:lipopolysaccharide heptosyltransferase II [Acidobacteriota bacterium]
MALQRLVILAPNWLGDAVMALPAIADLRRAAPQASIAVAARPAIAPLFRLVPDVNETIVLDSGRPEGLRYGLRWRSLGAEIANHNFDTAVLLPNSAHAALTALRAAIPERWGYATDWRGPLLTRAIAPPSGLHQVDYYQHLVHALGFPNGPVEPRVAVPDAAREGGRRALIGAGWDGQSPLVALAPGAAYGGAKKWPPESFAELAVALATDGVRCVLIGAAADAETCRFVARAFQARDDRGPERAALLNLADRTDLPTLAGVLTHCRALVSNDSGAMHFAAAAGVAVTAVFGPTDEHATRPMGDAHVVVSHRVWCRPCMLRECPLDHRCMRGIGVGRVLDAARRNL